MTKATHFPEPRPAHGGLAAEGALNLLGRPALDPLVVLIREAAQNSWDARTKDNGPVDFAIDLRTVDEAQRKALAAGLFADLPPRGLGYSGGSLLELGDALDEDDLWLMVLSDTGTRGLGGPLRADTPAGDDESTDFVDLVFNIGQPPDRTLGGGTYGFGKTISYLVSRCRTVIIHTVTEHRGKLQHRLIAQAVGHQYGYRSRNYTGRHWWGAIKGHGVEPLTGKAAASLAAKLGFPDLESRGGGTTLAIVAPDLTGKRPEQAATFMAHALLWNFWPKMVPDGPKAPAMRFLVQCEGRPIEVPAPETTPPLNAFAEALTAVRDCESGRRKPEDFPTFRIHELRSERPRASLGWLALHPVAAQARPRLDEGFDDEGEPTTAASFTEPAHHVALMRRPELIVQYRPGVELSNPAVEWAGVFKASEETNAAFAEAEPPTHDDWQPNLVREPWHRRYVNVSRKQIKEHVNNAFGAPVVPDEAPGRPSGVVVADALGHLLATHPGTGASKPRSDDPQRPTVRRTIPKVSVLRRWLGDENGAAVLNIEFQVEAASGSPATLIEASAAAATAEGGLEHDPPAGAPVPTVMGFRLGPRIFEGAALRVPAGDESPVVVTVSIPDGVAAAVDIRPVAEVPA